MSQRDGAEVDDLGWGESSRYAAHLDRGWALLDRGSLAAAETSAREAQQLRPEDPDAAILLGAIALANERADESVRWYDKAVELDPDYLEPYAAAAQVCLFDLDDPKRALEYCQEAIALDDLHPFELLDIQLLAAECEVVLGRHQAARQRLRELAEIRLLDDALTLSASPPEDTTADDEAVHLVRAFLETDGDGEFLDDDEKAQQLQRIVHFALRLARVWMDLREEGPAAALLRRIVDRMPDQADAWHALSEVELWAGDAKMACEAALQTARLDAQHALPSWLPSPALLHARVVEMLRGCGVGPIEELVDGSVSFTVVIGDTPPTELVLEGLDPRVAVLGLVTRGPHQSADAEAETDPCVTGLAVYRSNLVRFARDAEQLDGELRKAVLDEMAALLSLPEETRKALAIGRSRKAGPESRRSKQ